MFRMTTLKISLLSAFAALFLLVSMLASTGIASAHTTTSAHTTSCQPPSCTPYTRPQLWQPTGIVYTLPPDCAETWVSGSGYTPGSVTLKVIWFNPTFVYPSTTQADANGNFTTFIEMCGSGFGDYEGWNDPFLIGIDSAGRESYGLDMST